MNSAKGQQQADFTVAPGAWTLDVSPCPPTPALLTPEHAEQLAVVTKALADPVRLRIFHHIAVSRCSSVCACHLPEVFGVSQPTLSHHLKKLVDAGLVHREMRGRWAHFTPRPEGLAALRALLSTLPTPGDAVPPSVLFVCVKNGGKSQMAESLMRLRAGEAIRALSAGTQPGTTLNEESRASLERIGGTFEGQTPKGLDSALLRAVDRVVVIGDEAVVEPVGGMRGSIETWFPDEPSLRGIEGDERMDLIRDDLDRRIIALRDELLGA